MNKIILKNGLIAGSIVTAFMIITSIIFMKNPDFKPNEILGFGGMLIAFSFVFFGIKEYRDKQNGGKISFLQALKTGTLIALIASIMYVVTWLIEYTFFFPDFMEKYGAMVIKELQNSTKTSTEIAEETAKINQMKEWYKNPVYVALLTLMEVFPFGFFIALISSLILKRK